MRSRINDQITALGLVWNGLATAAAGATTSSTVAYRCDAGRTATARYDTSSLTGGFVLTIDGQVLSLKSDVSGSGARYTTNSDLLSITPLEWWTKDPNATLSELAPTPSCTNRLLTTCHQVP